MTARKSKTPQSPTVKADKKRIDILRSAAKCFRKTGFHQTSMQEICTEVGLGPGAVYRYFTGKEAIIEAMASDERQQTRALLPNVAEGEQLPDAFGALTYAIVERYAAAGDTGLMAEVYAEGLRNKRVGSAIRKSEADWVAVLADLLRAAQARGQVDPALDAQHTALFLTAMWDGIVLRQAYHPEENPAALPAFFNTMIKRLLARDAKAEKRAKTPIDQIPAFLVQTPAETAAAAEISAEADHRQLSLI